MDKGYVTNTERLQGVHKIKKMENPLVRHSRTLDISDQRHVQGPSVFDITTVSTMLDFLITEGKDVSALT